MKLLILFSIIIGIVICGDLDVIGDRIKEKICPAYTKANAKQLAKTVLDTIISGVEVSTVAKSIANKFVELLPQNLQMEVLRNSSACEGCIKETGITMDTLGQRVGAALETILTPVYNSMRKKCVAMKGKTQTQIQTQIYLMGKSQLTNAWMKQVFSKGKSKCTVKQWTCVKTFFALVNWANFL